MSTLELILICSIFIGLLLSALFIGLLKQIRWLFLPAPHYFQGMIQSTESIEPSNENKKGDNRILATLIFMSILFIYLFLMNNQNQIRDPSTQNPEKSILEVNSFEYID